MLDVGNDSRAVNQEFKTLIKSKILSMNRSLDFKDIDALVYEESKVHLLTIEESHYIAQEIYDEMYRLGMIQKYLDDDSINEIMINGLDPIIIEKEGQILVTEAYFSSIEALNNLIQRIVSAVNRRVNAASPVVDARLEDGSRVNIVLPPVALNGPIITIRKFREKAFDLDWYELNGILSKDSKTLIKTLIECKYNIFVSGGTSSGKTTFLNALSDHIPSVERVITIEDSAELKLSNISNLVSLETKHKNLQGQGEISIGDLIKCALRMRPDRIIVGEIRGKEALDMIHAMNTGHDGSLSTGHANSARDMLSRIELMILSNMDLPISVVRKLIASSLDILIHLERDLNGKRYVKEVYELLDYKDDYKINELYILKNCKLVKVNELVDVRKIESYGKNKKS